MTTVDILTPLNKAFRDHRRYTGDGLANEPTGAPLPIGDPESGVHDPDKPTIRGAFGSVQTAMQAGVDAAETAATAAQVAQAGAETARAEAEAIVGFGVTDIRSYGGVADGSNSATALVDALATGRRVLVPAVGTWVIQPTTAQAAAILAALDRVDAEDTLTITLPSGTVSVASGVLARIGPNCHNIRIVGAAPVETTLSSVASVSGSAGAWTVVLNVASGTGIAVGDVLKLFDVGPLPMLGGDNSAASTLRAYPLPNELYHPPVNVGTITAASGGGSAAFSSVTGTLSDYIKVGDLLTLKGQTRVVASVGASSVGITGAWTNGVSGSRGFWVTRPNAGTIGTGGASSTTITGASSAFTTEANVGDVLLVDGQFRKITAIGSDTSLTVDQAITLSSGTAYSVLTGGVLHEGAHEVTAVSGTQITVVNRSQAQPPVNRVTTGSVKALKTILKNTGTGDGFVFEQGASLRWLDQVALQGDRATSGSIALAGNDRISAGVFGDFTQHGTTTEYICGPSVAILDWGRGVVAGHGCVANIRNIAISGCLGISLWALEGSDVNARRAVISGGGSTGSQINAGAKFVFTEARHAGNNGDGMRVYDGGAGYAEQSFWWGNQGMGARNIGAGGFHANEGVSFCNTASALYVDKGEAEVERLVAGANARAGIEAIDLSKVLATEAWISGATGSGYGIYAKSSKVNAEGAGVVGNSVEDVYADAMSEVYMPASVIGDVSAYRQSRVDLKDGEATAATVGTGGRIYVQGVSPAPSLTGVRHMGGVTADGSTIYTDASPWTTYTVVVASSAGAIASYTQTGRYREIDGDIEVEIDVTVTDNGTGSGLVTASLPVSAAGGTALAGTNLSTGVALTAYTSGGDVNVLTAAAAYPVATGNRILVSGRYRPS